jgi:hypothetical protein
MSIAATLYHNVISEVSGYAVYAEARLGGNGDPNGVPELVTGGNGEDASYDRITWDADLTDGFDTGNVADALAAAFDAGTNTATADRETGGTPISFSQASAGPIERVELRALTQAAATARWSNVCIEFYRGGVLMDSYSAEYGPSVDTVGETSNATAESVLVVTPDGTDYDQVVISGMVRMTFDSPTVLPGATDVALQAFVYTSTT